MAPLRFHHDYPVRGQIHVYVQYVSAPRLVCATPASIETRRRTCQLTVSGSYSQHLPKETTTPEVTCIPQGEKSSWHYVPAPPAAARARGQHATTRVAASPVAFPMILGSIELGAHSRGSDHYDVDGTHLFSTAY